MSKKTTATKKPATPSPASTAPGADVEEAAAPAFKVGDQVLFHSNLCPHSKDELQRLRKQLGKDAPVPGSFKDVPAMVISEANEKGQYQVREAVSLEVHTTVPGDKAGQFSAAA